MEYITLIILGILPSLIWLFYFLEKDNDPEPKLIIFLIFAFGIFGAFVALLSQSYFRSYIYTIDFTLYNRFETVAVILFDSFLAVALLEEMAKLFAFFLGISLVSKKELDEPVDFIIYMVTAGLGFAALENFIYFSNAPRSVITELILLRFAVTTFFHAISAGILGYFIAFSVKKIKKYLVLVGLMVVSFFHMLYNILIELMSSSTDLFYPGFLLSFLFVLSIILLRGFKETKSMKSICDVL